MKLVIAVIQDYDTDAFLRAATGNGLMATRIASAGGFLRTGNTTVFLGVEDEQVALVKRLLREHCRIREVVTAVDDLPFLDDTEFEHVTSTRIGGGVAFVARVARFEKFSQTSAESDRALVN